MSKIAKYLISLIFINFYREPRYVDTGKNRSIF